jgi:hypothetical protein
MLYSVYAHKIGDVVFYVGCGVKERPWNTKNRSSHWYKLTQANPDFTVEILSEHDNRREALEAEKRAIKHFKPKANIQNNPIAPGRHIRSLAKRYTNTELSTMERALSANEMSLQIKTSREFLRHLNVESARRGMTNREFIIKLVLENSQEEF